MMLTNKTTGDHFAEVANDLLSQKLGDKITFAINGKAFARYEHNVDVRGASERPAGTMPKVYRDHVGRYTLEPLGEAVGVLLRGGFSNRLCHVGFFEEVKPASHH